MDSLEFHFFYLAEDLLSKGIEGYKGKLVRHETGKPSAEKRKVCK